MARGKIAFFLGGLACFAATTTVRAGTIAVDTTASSANQADGVTTASIANFTVANNPNRLLVVTVGGEYGAAVSSVTFGGQSMTNAAEKIQSPTASSLWYLVNPNATTAAVTVTLASGLNGWVFGAASFYNVAQQGPFATTTNANAGSSNPSVSIAVPSDGLVVESIASNFTSTTGNPSPQSGQTTFVSTNDGGSASGGWNAAQAYDTSFTGNPSTQSWTLANTRWAESAASFQAVPEPASLAGLGAGLLLMTLRRRRRTTMTACS